jgi:hypothetical protein
MQVGARVVSGADHVVCLLLDYVCLYSPKAYLRSSYEELAVPLQNCVMQIRGPIVDLSGLTEISGHGTRVDSLKRLAHSRGGVGLGYLLMAAGADCRVDVIRLG